MVVSKLIRLPLIYSHFIKKLLNRRWIMQRNETSNTDWWFGENTAAGTIFMSVIRRNIALFCNMKLRNLSKMYKRNFCILFKQCEIPLIHLKYVLTNNLLSLTYWSGVDDLRLIKILHQHNIFKITCLVTFIRLTCLE